jgi:hypothetical protein
MTSTSEGLQALASETGYQHHTTMEIKESVARGCPLCQAIFSGWGLFAEESERLVFFAQFNHHPCWKMTAENGSTTPAPLMLDNLTGYGYREGKRQGWVIPLTLFTAPGRRRKFDESPDGAR